MKTALTTAVDFIAASVLVALVALAGLLAIAGIGFVVGVPLGIVVWCVRFALSV